jgi:hypothetical protein
LYIYHGTKQENYKIQNVFPKGHRIMNSHITPHFILLLLISALSSGSSARIAKAIHAADYYLAPGGSDDNPGTITQPWKTLEHAITQLSQGDNLYLRGGTYYPRLKRRHKNL